MNNVFFKCCVAVVCHILRRKNIIVRYAKVFTGVKTTSVLKRYIEIGIRFESIGILQQNCKQRSKTGLLHVAYPSPP